MGLLPFSVKAVAEAKVALARLKVGHIHNFLSFITHCQKVFLLFPMHFVPLAPLSAQIRH